MIVPFTDLSISPRVHLDIIRGLSAIQDSQAFVGGAQVREFEEAWAEYCGARYCVAVGNGTDAIELAARSIWAPRELVTVPALTFIGTVEGLERALLRVAVVDVDEHYLVAAMPDVGVSLYRPAVQCDSTLVDMAQGHGGRHQGLASTWSFYPTKNLGAWGDAGAVTTNEQGLAQEVRERANHGFDDGFNSRMDSIQAAVLLAKLPYLNEALAARQAAGERYRTMLAGTSVRLLPGSYPWHLFVVRVPAERRTRMMEKVREAGIDARVHYRQTVQWWGGRYLPGICPRADQAVNEIVSLPLFPTITAAQQAFVVETLIGAL